MTRTPRALVYGDVDLNLIDGSAVWAQSTVQALSRAGCRTRLVLKAPEATGRLTDPLAGLPGVTVVRPYEEHLVPGQGAHPLSPFQASQLLARLDTEEPCDLLVLRGRRLVRQVVADGAFEGRIWAYLTDIPQSPAEMTEQARTDLARIAAASRQLLCQTEELRCFLEAWVPEACGRSVLSPPAVPEPGFPVPGRNGRPHDPLRLVYTGKFAPRWNTLPMTRLPALLAERGVRTELHTVGDKIHKDAAHPGFETAMAEALRTTPEVVHHGGVPREEAMRIAAGCDLGLGWRDASLDASLELSTKVLEFGALGLPVVLNRTPAHEALLGGDYPLFVPGGAALFDAADAVALAVHDPGARQLAADRCAAAARQYTMEAAATRWRAHLDRAFPSAPAAVTTRARPLRVGVAGHDLKFLTRLLDHFRALPGLEVRVDEWPALARHDPAASRELAGWADVVVVEWCGPAAVWYSRHKRRGSRLIVRLHRFELDAGYPRQVDIDAVDRVVCVSPYYARSTHERTGWPAAKITTIGNWVDVDQFDRPKAPGARHRLGMIGIAPSRKRLDLGLDVLEALRAHDRRWHLSVKSKPPWEYWWIWNKPEERAHYEEVLRRMQTSPLLEGAVVFDRFGPDVPGWLRRVGHVLSTSDDESFHLAPAEGMASGAVPALLPWPGADEIYDRRWIHGTPEAMAEAIAGLAEQEDWQAAGETARGQVREGFSLDRVAKDWTELLVSG
ncbi:glycosyltransferase involved in cell wall biosynthesis [Streptomyces sp. Ag109_O5-1]|uniref:glycosyltransferase n=1 Tax=Streptomyces sp. Ag109_O5-1 TaxID=1938851 RepID=UPI000F4E36C7|nr:glycosyltransferase [Streptomyces sp. Ag109_O5-1]RPE38439.1 glycosyltransferase involved in cell wall biosynthesis [Streptomyces sp. Ag109_O5-1]